MLPCYKDIISNVLGGSELQKLKHVSLSNDTDSRQITELSDNILLRVVSKIHNSIFNFFAIWIDETNNVINSAQFCVYVAYVMYMISTWKTNSCFVKPSAPKQPQEKY